MEEDPRDADPKPEPSPEARPDAPADGGRDRRLLGAFLVYVLLLAVAVFGQLTGSRAILDLFDLGRHFTR